MSELPSNPAALAGKMIAFKGMLEVLLPFCDPLLAFVLALIATLVLAHL